MTLEEKWQQVREFYEPQYRKALKNPRFKFEKMLKPEDIEMLYKNMQKLQSSISHFYDQNPSLAGRLNALSGRVIESKEQ